jgi:hypothetical protein
MIKGKVQYKGIQLAPVFALFFGGAVLMYIQIAIMVVAGGYSGIGPEMMGGVFLAVLGFAALIVGVILFCIMLYRIWFIIQDGVVRTTPGKAVGFLFIPLFNCYWIFVAYYGLSRDFNRYIADNNYDVEPMSTGLFLSYSILELCVIIPYVGSLAALANLIIMIIVHIQIGTRLNALAIIRNNE